MPAKTSLINFSITQNAVELRDSHNFRMFPSNLHLWKPSKAPRVGSFAVRNLVGQYVDHTMCIGGPKANNLRVLYPEDVGSLIVGYLKKAAEKHVGSALNQKPKFGSRMFKFSCTRLKSMGNNYTSLSTMDQNDVIREKLRHSKSLPKVAKRPEKVHDDTITALLVVRPGMVLSASRDTKINLTNMDVSENALLWEGHQAEVTKLAYRNAVGKHMILSGCRDASINMWLFNATDPVCSFVGHKLAVSGIAIIDDQRFLSGSRDTSMKLWDIDRPKELRSVVLNRNLVTHVTFSQQSGLVAQTSEDKTVKIWSPKEMCVVKTFPMKHHIQMHCEFTDDGNSLVSCSNGFNGDGCEITVYDMRTMKLQKELRGHEGSVTCVANLPLSDHRKLIVSVGADKTVRLWRIDEGSLIWTEETPFDVADSMQVCTYVEGQAKDGRHSVVVSGGRGRLAHLQAKTHAGRVVLDSQCFQPPKSALSSSYSHHGFRE